MINEYKREVLRERLQILNLLEALVTRAPDQGGYEEMLSDFALGITASSMEAHLREIEKGGIAKFILPAGLNRWTFWDAPVRITHIELDKLQAMQESVREELAGMTTISGSAPEIPEGDEDRTDDGNLPRSGQNSQASSVVIFAAILGFVATVTSIIAAIFSWSLLETDLARGISIAGLVLLAITLTRLTVRLKKARPFPWTALFDLTVVGALCVCAALVLSTVLSPAKKAASLVSTLAHGPVSVTIKPPWRFDIPLINNFSGHEVNLQPGQVIWTFNQNIESNGKFSPTTYPDSGPCTVNYVLGIWDCRRIYIGSTRDKRYYHVCAAVLSASNALDVVNLLRNTLANRHQNPNLKFWFASPPPYIHDDTPACMSVHRIN
jgi:hypothetical protein